MAVLLKFDPLQSFENYIRLYKFAATLTTFYFQVQFIKVHCAINTKNAIKCAVKKEPVSAKQQRDLEAKKIYIMITKKK